MPIEFEAPKPLKQAKFILKTVGEEMIRPKSRYYDEHEHEIPWDYIEFMHAAMRATGGSSLAPRENGKDKEEKEKLFSASSLGKEFCFSFFPLLT